MFYKNREFKNLTGYEKRLQEVTLRAAQPLRKRSTASAAALIARAYYEVLRACADSARPYIGQTPTCTVKARSKKFYLRLFRIDDVGIDVASNGV